MSWDLKAKLEDPEFRDGYSRAWRDQKAKRFRPDSPQRRAFDNAERNRKAFEQRLRVYTGSLGPCSPPPGEV